MHFKKNSVHCINLVLPTLKSFQGRVQQSQWSFNYCKIRRNSEVYGLEFPLLVLVKKDGPTNPGFSIR